MPESAPRVEPEQALFELKRPRWQARAACRPDVIPHIWQQFDDCNHPTDLFYPPQTPTDARLDAIIQVCATCPVREECHEFGVVHERNGWWGGRNPTELDQERRARGISADILELDPRSRKVIGTFIAPGHGSPERYQQHIRDKEQACEACISAWHEFYKPVRKAAYEEHKKVTTPEERLAKNRAARVLRNKRKAEGTLRYRG